jgi:hypothetical protein
VVHIIIPAEGKLSSFWNVPTTQTPETPHSRLITFLNQLSLDEAHLRANRLGVNINFQTEPFVSVRELPLSQALGAYTYGSTEVGDVTLADWNHYQQLREMIRLRYGSANHFHEVQLYTFREKTQTSLDMGRQEK